MECQEIMHTPPHRLYVDSTIQEASEMLVKHHMYNLPVVDRDEIFVGEISTRCLIGLMLPTSLSMDMGLTHTGFMRETGEDILKRIRKVWHDPITSHIATDITVVYPDSPLIDALMLLYQKYIRIPVVERDSGRLVGGISFITLLRAVEESI